MLVVTADPFAEFFSCLFGDDLDAEVHEAEPDPFVGPGVDHFHASARFLNDLMAGTAVHVKDDRIGIVEDRFVGGPTV